MVGLTVIIDTGKKCKILDKLLNTIEGHGSWTEYLVQYESGKIGTISPSRIESICKEKI